MNNRELPNNVKAEQGICGKLLSSPELVSQIDNLQVDDFYNQYYKGLFLAILNLYNTDNSVDRFNIIPKLADKGFLEDALIDITASYDYMSSFDYLIDVVVDLSCRRKSIVRSYEFIAKCEDLSLNFSDSKSSHISDINSIQDNGDDDMTISAGCSDVSEIIRNNDKHIFTGTLSGFSQLDNFGGLQKGHLMIIGASTSVGKTSLALNILSNVAHDNIPTAMYSMEMTKAELSARLIASESGVSSSSILYRKLEDYDRSKVANAWKIVNAMPIYINERCRTTEGIIRDIRTKHRKHDIRGVVIDYLQMMPRTIGKNESDARALGEIARAFKDLAKELGIWVILLSQFNRDEDASEPELKKIRGSGEICEAADEVILIWRPELHNGSYKGEFNNVCTHNTAQFILAKGRSTGIGKWIQGYQPEITKFYDLDSLPTSEYKEELSPF